MPANPRTLALEQLYLREQRDLSRRVAAAVQDQWSAYSSDTADLRRAIQRFVASAAAMVEGGQARAQALAAGFTRQLVQLEAGRAYPQPGTSPDIAGTTTDGRPLRVALAAVAPAVFVALSQGRSLAAALGAGGAGAARLAATEVTDAGRREVGAQAEAAGDQLAGWVWVISDGGGCAACLASANNDTHGWDETLEGHPWCTCIRSPVVAGVASRVERMTGAELFAAMSPADQAASFHSSGEAKAALVATGAASLDDMVARTDSHEWRGMLVERPLADLQ